MSESGVTISSIGSEEYLSNSIVNPNVYINFFKITAILLVITICIVAMKGIKNKKIVVPCCIVSGIMALISYLSYSFIANNINEINGSAAMSCTLQKAGSIVALVANIIIAIIIVFISFYKGKTTDKEDFKNEQKNS